MCVLMMREPMAFVLMVYNLFFVIEYPYINVIIAVIDYIIFTGITEK